MVFKKTRCTLLLMGLFLISCNLDSSNPSHKINDNINALKTNKEKRAYLEKIYDDDQKVRGQEGQEIMILHGNDSQEMQDYIKSQLKQDADNLVKVEAYMNRYGHPSKDSLGWKAASTPWAVIHHAQENAPRRRNFKMLYGGFKNGDIDDGALTFYLNRMYQFNNQGERLKMKNPFTSEDEIDTLIQLLKLEVEQSEVDDTFIKT